MVCRTTECGGELRGEIPDMPLPATEINDAFCCGVKKNANALSPDLGFMGAEACKKADISTQTSPNINALTTEVISTQTSLRLGTQAAAAMSIQKYPTLSTKPTESISIRTSPDCDAYSKSRTQEAVSAAAVDLLKHTQSLGVQSELCKEDQQDDLSHSDAPSPAFHEIHEFASPANDKNAPPEIAKVRVLLSSVVCPYWLAEWLPFVLLCQLI